MLEHLEHGVEHSQHEHVALLQPVFDLGRSLRISNFLSCLAHKEKVTAFVSGDFRNS